MKCQVCGIEIGGEASIAGLSVSTNETPNGQCFPSEPSDSFAAIFAFWNQRTKSHLILCGACLCERIMWMDQPVGTFGTSAPITGIVATIVKNDAAIMQADLDATADNFLTRSPIDEK